MNGMKDLLIHGAIINILLLFLFLSYMSTITINDYVGITGVAIWIG